MISQSYIQIVEVVVKASALQNIESKLIRIILLSMISQYYIHVVEVTVKVSALHNIKYN